MKQEFTLQEIFSIKKQTWLNWVNKHLTEDEQKEMMATNIKFNKYNQNDDEFKDIYLIKGNIYIQFYDEHLIPMKTYWIKSYNNGLLENPNQGIQELFKSINELIIFLCDLSVGNPLQVAEKVTEVLNELLAK